MPKPILHTAVFDGRKITQSTNSWLKTLNVRECQIRKRLRAGMDMQQVVDELSKEVPSTRREVAVRKFIYGR